MFFKTPLTERIQRFLDNYPNATYIPVHPDDYAILESANALEKFPLPFKELGKIYAEEFEE
jgi:hypothetical protein